MWGYPWKFSVAYNKIYIILAYSYNSVLHNKEFLLLFQYKLRVVLYEEEKFFFISQQYTISGPYIMWC